MRNRSLLRAACLALATSLGACASRPNAPPNFLPSPKKAAVETHGSWIELTIATAGPEMHLAGELLAVTVDSVWITTQPDSIRSSNAGFVVPRRAIIAGKLVWFQADAATLGLLSFLGTLSTVSNGVYLVFTAPMWVVGGSIATGVYSREPLIALVPDTGRDLRPFARFPAGMPVGLDASFRRIGEPERSRSPPMPYPEDSVP